ncbi:MAG TPA: nucleotide exchange factor GrpE [Alphaproteobacteria bacterium]|nr:nucleotide exchange factor GrpE [Alphaproteobacteria bacterium]
MTKQTESQNSTPLEAEDLVDTLDEGTLPEGQPDVAGLLREGDEWRQKALRYAADLENYRKRAAQDVESARLYASQSFARDMLGVADNLARALQVEATDANKALLDGVNMVESNLQQTLKRHGVSRIVVKPGDALNPELHQVMNEVAADVAPGTIAHELQPGYTLNGRLLRPAFVSVATKI